MYQIYNAVPDGRGKGRADAGGTRVPCDLFQLGNIGDTCQDHPEDGVSVQAYRAAV